MPTDEGPWAFALTEVANALNRPAAGRAGRRARRRVTEGRAGAARRRRCRRRDTTEWFHTSVACAPIAISDRRSRRAAHSHRSTPRLFLQCPALSLGEIDSTASVGATLKLSGNSPGGRHVAATNATSGRRTRTGTAGRQQCQHSVSTVPTPPMFKSNGHQHGQATRDLVRSSPDLLLHRCAIDEFPNAVGRRVLTWERLDVRISFACDLLRRAKSHLSESNRRPRIYKIRALPTELRWQAHHSSGRWDAWRV